MSCEHCGYGRWAHCPICCEDQKESNKQLAEFREELETLNRMKSRGEQVDEYEYQGLLDDIDELENEN